MKQPVEKFFHDLRECALCYGKNQIFVPESRVRSGDGTPRIFILGEQPDRETCLVSGVNGFDHPDPNIARLREYLKLAGVDENDVFYTTSVMCIPRDAAKRGPRPSAKETKNCTRHVESLLRMLRPKLLIPLGHTSILSLQWIYTNWTELRQFILNYDVGNVLEKDGVAAYPLYYPSAATLKVRSADRQGRDWKRVPAILESLEKKTAMR
jgi:uracil-DNA glycosylase family 4